MKIKKVAIIVPTLLIIGLLIIFAYNGILWPNKIFANKYPIHGIDVSNHQKDIDWEAVAKSKNIKFVFIKATEGMDFKDKYFKSNWEAATKTNLYVGAYHYFKITSSGKEQAENFMDMVPQGIGVLPPVIDLEENGLEKDEFRRELQDYIDIVEQHYRQKPILYVVYPIYNQYIKGDFEEYQIWIRDIVKPPRLDDKREWTFWQYSDRGKIDGISTFVDLNIFKGSLDDLKILLLP